ncbi:MAG: hypothetical protein ABII64_09870 [Elusimicrobiota bacterium]
MREILRMFVLLSCCLTFFSAVFAETKKIIVIADWGAKGVPDDIIGIAEKYPKLKFAFAWRADAKISEKVLSLVQNGRLEPVLALQNEPAMPLVYKTVISTPFAADFSWPDDIWQAVVAAQQEFRSAWGKDPGGLYLRSGMVSEHVAEGLRKLGVNWLNIVASGAVQQVSKYGDQIIFTDNCADFPDAEKYLQFVSSGQLRYSALFFGLSAPVKKDFLAELAAGIENTADAEMILPQDVLSIAKDEIPDIRRQELNPDVSRWKKNPVIWQRLYKARTALEEYKNSGFAQVPVLDALRGEMLNLYRYDFLLQLNQSPDGPEEQMFQAGISNIYRLIKKPLPPEMTESLSIQTFSLSGQSFSLESSSEKVILFNSRGAEGLAGISSFEVRVTTRNVIYGVTLASGAVESETVIDIYIDMNNKRNAGFTKMLQGLEAYLKPQDAWEFAVRVENGEVKLYRSGRLTPALAKKEKLLQNYRIVIPRSLLRGDPFKWRYQVILAAKKDPLLPMSIEDFLCPENLRYERLLERIPVELPAIKLSR